MMVILSRPPTEYTKKDIEKSFAVLAGSRAESGIIHYDKLNSAVSNGAGGIDPDIAEEMMTMMDHTPHDMINYRDMINLFMGTKKL
jgi:hypothetical protein